MNRLKVLQTLPARLAAELNRRTQYWNKKSKLIALGGFVLLFGTGCIWLIFNAVCR